MPSKKPRSSGLMAIRSGKMPLTKNDLKNHIWLCTAVAKADTAQPGSFNYFFTSCTGEAMAYRLEMLR